MELIQGDCLEVMKSIPSGSVDAIITDPPYGTTACKWDSVIDFEFMWEQLNRIIKPNGAIVLFGSEPFSSALRMSNINNYKYDWVWDKTESSGHFNVKRMPLKQHENIIIFYKKQCVYNRQFTKKEKKNQRPNRKQNSINNKKTITSDFYGEKKVLMSDEYDTTRTNPKSIIKISSSKTRKNKQHPTQKPIELMEYLIKTYTNEGETVLDFTMGSGSTMVACQNTNRNGIGIEQDSKYFKIAQDRVEANKFKLF